MRLLLALALAVAPASSLAHEVLHEVAADRAIAVHAWESDGEPLADCAWQAFAPADPAAPWASGRTDRSGWLAFVPSMPGGWRVRVVDPTGHGLDVVVPSDARLPAAAAEQVPAWPLRFLLGLVAIAVIFLLLRRRRAT
jgi:nickel transport protein